MKRRFFKLFACTIALYLLVAPNFAETKTPPIDQNLEKPHKSIDQGAKSEMLNGTELQLQKNPPAIQTPQEKDGNGRGIVKFPDSKVLK
jgi:hypothetical protein